MTGAPRQATPERVREVLDLALERPSAERDAFVAGACGQDAALCSEVRSLLAALDAGGDMLEPETAGVPAAAEPLTGLEIGAYRVGARLGAGGMGVVYQAHDTRLGRTVAVKALPPHLARDPHRRARFEQEARVLASLNHPNIAAIHGVEPSPRGTVMILEYVPGPTLADRLRSGALPLDEAVQVACQVARALEAAHAAGVIHRDLKPANIKITPEGVVKVLDFGIAKVTAAGPLDRPHESPPAGRPDGPHTSAGALLGTAAYMSPEQTRGRPVDRRADLWALGCVLFEMLAGRRVFDGGTASDTVASILRADPDWSRLPADLPEGVRRVLDRCLEKDPERRMRDAGDARIELEAALRPHAPPPQSAPAHRRLRPVLIALGAVALLALAVFAGRTLWTPRPPAQADVTRFSIEAPEGASIMADTAGGALAVAPDGSSIAFAAGPAASGAGRSSIYVRRLDALEANPLPGVELPAYDAGAPCFSPDGRWIAYARGGESPRIFRVLADGSGAPVPLIDEPGGICGLAWTLDNRIVYGTYGTGNLWAAPAFGGTPAPITTIDPARNEQSHIQPFAIPGAVLFTCLRLEGEVYSVAVESVELSTGRRVPLIDNACQPRVINGDTLLFYRAGSLMAAPFDAARLSITGDARRILQPLAGSEIVPRCRYAVSASGGVLAYLPSPISYEATELAWFAPGRPAVTAISDIPTVLFVRLSPDGRRIVFGSGDPVRSIWIHDLERGTTTRLTRSGRHEYPVWSRDGRHIAFLSLTPDQPARVEWIPVDGSEPARTLYTCPPGSTAFPSDFTLDDRQVLITRELLASHRTDMVLVPTDGSGTAAPMLAADTPESPSRLGARLSPDGALVAYTGYDSGRAEVYLSPFPAMDRRIHVSAEGGLRPAWTADGRTLFFQNLDRIYAVDVSRTPNLSVSAPRLVLADLPLTRYDAALDGSRFILGRPKGGSGRQTKINIVLGWRQELEHALGAEPRP